MIIGLVGNTDNRVILYPLIKLAESRGDVAVISNNRHLRRLLADPTEETGYYGNVLVAVTEMHPEDVWDALEINPKEYDTVIYDLGVTGIIEGVDKYIYIQDYGTDESEGEFLEALTDEGEYTTVRLSYDGKRDKKAQNIRMTIKDMAAIHKSEYLREIQDFPNGTLQKFLYEQVGSNFGMNLKGVSGVLREVRGSGK